MSDIQVDMFEVQLGASILIQAQRGQEILSILADGGIMASGYARDHVLGKLPAVMDAFLPGRRRIDLIIGTHYDRDHLIGLVPIIEDRGIEVGEVWMPPVLDERGAAPPRNRALRPHDFLGQRMWDEGPEFLRGYLAAKLRDCDEFASLQDGLTGRGPERSGRRRGEDAEPTLEAFEEHVRASAVELDHAGGKPDDPVRIPGSGAESLLRARDRHRGAHLPRAGAAVALAYLRNGSARDAINALALDQVISALRGRRLKPSFKVLRDGIPQEKVWNQAKNRFQADGTSEFHLTILAPSAGLVRKHADRLPTGRYAAAAYELARPITKLSPSNQLSYVVRFDAGAQRILVTGDAGMVDFRLRGRWHPRLVAALTDLDVVQVAHHGGNNAYFYEALLEAPPRTKTTDEFYLLSHATHDQYRPSKAFEDFLDDREVRGNRARLLFTSQPTGPRVAGYRELIDPVVGTPGLVGDVRLEFDGSWGVTAHGVAVPGP